MQKSKGQCLNQPRRAEKRRESPRKKQTREFGKLKTSCINTTNLCWSINLQAWDRNHLYSMELIVELLPKTHDLQLKSNQVSPSWNNNNLHIPRGIQQNPPHATHNVLENTSLFHIQRNRKMWPYSWAGLGKKFSIICNKLYIII